jgi:hypothetical protein
MAKLHAASPLAESSGPELQKAVAASDFAGIYLQRLAKLMMNQLATNRLSQSAV